MVLVQWEMHSVSSKIWIRVAVSISYDDNNYTTGTSCVLQLDYIVILSCILAYREL